MIARSSEEEAVKIILVRLSEEDASKSALIPASILRSPVTMILLERNCFLTGYLRSWSAIIFFSRFVLTSMFS